MTWRVLVSVNGGTEHPATDPQDRRDAWATEAEAQAFLERLRPYLALTMTQKGVGDEPAEVVVVRMTATARVVEDTSPTPPPPSTEKPKSILAWRTRK